MNASHPHILIVEDELIVALELEVRLRQQGYAIAGAVCSADEALDKIAKVRVDLALVDIGLIGVRDGVDLASDLRECDIPVVFLTAHGDEETLGRVKSVEAQGYLLKPFDERLLHLTLETALHRHTMERARLRAERAQRAAETLQASILERLPDGVLVVVEDGTIELGNAAAQEMFQLSQDELSRAELTELLPEHGYAELLPATRKSARRLEGRRSTGTCFPVEITSGLTPADDGERLILIVRDVSTQVQLEHQLSRARQLEIAGRVASGVAHDLNNLLSIVWMNTYMMRKAPQSRQTDLLSDLENAVRLGAAMTTRLLSMAKRTDSGPREVVLNDALRNIVSLVSRCMSTQVRLELVLDPRAGIVLLDPVLLDMCIMNLTLNADRAMPKGGLLTIRSAVAEANPAFVEVEVEDTGVGMSSQVQRRLFEPFFSTHHESGGTGLGLSIVQDISEKVGGQLEFESALGRGTRFCLTLPRHGAANDEHEMHVSVGDTELAGQCRLVLLVDDDESHRLSLARVLEGQNFRSVHARGAGEALLIAERGPPLTLAIIDLEMPYMDGAELSARIKQQHGDLPVMLISGSPTVTPGDYPSADMLLRKPIEPRVLFDEITRLLAKGSAP